MTMLELIAIMPLIVLSSGIVVLILQIAFLRKPDLSWAISLLALICTILACVSSGSEPMQATPLLIIDPISRLFSLLFLCAAIVVTLLSREYLTFGSDESEEYYLLLLLSTLGALVLASATHIASFLLGLEILSIALYTLIAYPDRGKLPLEASIKYLVLSGAASATLLFGFGLIYAATGSLQFEEIGQRMQHASVVSGPILLGCAGILVCAGLAFKLSLVPFHLWTPDVYQGAPAPVAGYLATVSKGAVFVVLLRWFLSTEPGHNTALVSAITLLACLSMLAGNLLALLQQNLKRILAYSSIAHIGYLAVIIVALAGQSESNLAVEATVYYLAAYTTATLTAFALIGMQRGSDHTEIDTVDSLGGLFWRQPVLALGMTVALLSLAGIPLTAGFIGKFYLLSAAVENGLWLLIVAMVIGSGIGIFYYLRIIFTMSKPGSPTEDVHYSTGPILGVLVIVALVTVILALGIYPQPLMHYLGTTL